LKILIVGFGSIGKRHLENLLSKTNSEIIVYSKRTDLNSLNKKNIKIFNSLERCLSEKPDIGFITNETAYHIPVAIKLAKSGLDLFIEKPLSNSIENIIVLKNLVRQKKLITQMGFNFRFHDAIKKIRQSIKERKIGRIISVQVEHSSHLPDWHPYEDYKKGYAAKKDLGGGVVLTQSHELDYLYWFFGYPETVFSVTGKFSDLKISTDDLSTSIIKFKNDIIAQIHLSFFQGPEYRSCQINVYVFDFETDDQQAQYLSRLAAFAEGKGTKGTIFWNSESNEVKMYDNKKKRWSVLLKLIKFERNQMYVDEIKHFLNCVKKRKKTINDLEEGIKTMKIALAIKKSAENEKKIKLN